MDQAHEKLNAGIAGVSAIASIPYVGGYKFSYGLGVGNYANGNAIAAGVQYKPADNVQLRLNVSWDSSDNAVVGMGISGGW
ncbi:YadA-like family protein [Plesiomonas sp. PI-19]|nr:YadA-like family protein [Plesiomonas sp. PI-19]